jgi:hypothetical protein
LSFADTRIAAIGIARIRYLSVRICSKYSMMDLI